MPLLRAVYSFNLLQDYIILLVLTDDVQCGLCIHSGVIATCR
jgi:hypothetical protein